MSEEVKQPSDSGSVASHCYRADLEGRLPIVYNGKSVEEWYSLYCQEAMRADRLQKAVDEMTVVDLSELTPDEQVAMDKATAEFTAWMDRQKLIQTLSDPHWRLIEHAAVGLVSGTSEDWPAQLVQAIERARGRKLNRESSSWLQGFCEALILSR